MKSILVIDDNEEFRETARMVLLDAGYDVFDAPAPKEALPILEAEGKTLDLIICDLHMPYCTGPEAEDYVYSCETGLKTIHTLVEQLPDVSVMALSSIPPKDLFKVSQYLDPVPAFSKPRNYKDLIRIVEEQLNVPMKFYMQ